MARRTYRGSEPPLPRRTPKTETQYARNVVTAAGVQRQEVQVPLANLGVPIPYLVGRQKIFSPNTIWYGNVRPIVRQNTSVSSTTETVREETSPGNFEEFEVTTEVVTVTTTTEGYYISMQFSLCLGPDAVLRKIGVGEQVIWEGTAGPARTEIAIAQNDSYVQGTAIFAGGEFDQAPDTFLDNFIDPEDLPGYVGVAYLILQDVRADQISGTPWFEIERFPNPLGLSGANNRLGDDINIASAIADFLSTDWGGAGMGSSAIDTATFTTSATRLATEGNGCSFQLNQETDAATVVDLLQGQADGLVFENPATGTVKFRLVRFDLLSPLTSWKLYENAVSRVGRWAKSSWVGTFNRLRFSFTSREKNYEQASITAYNSSAVNDRIKSTRDYPIDYPTVHTQALALKLAGRELTKLGQPITVAEVETDRKVAGALPGDAVQLYLPERGLPSQIGVAVVVRRFPLGDNRTILNFVQVPRGTTDIQFGTETDEGDDLSIAPDQPDAATIIQPPYFLARKTGLNLSTVNSGAFTRALLIPEIADNLQETFSAYIANVPGAADLVRVIGFAPYAVLARLDGAIGQFDGADDGILTFDIDNVIGGDRLSTQGLQGVREGRFLLFVDDEIMSFQTVTDNGDGSFTLTTVHRGLLDTAPQAHADNARVYVLDSSASLSIAAMNFSVPPGYTPAWRITSNTAFAETDPDVANLAVSSFVPTTNRLKAPYHPHHTQIDGVLRSISTGLNDLGVIGHIITPSQVLTITWRTRNRATTTIAIQTDAAESGEIDAANDYMVHRVLIRDSGGVLRDCGATSDDQTYNTLNATVHPSTALGAGVLFVRAETLYGDSLYEDQIPVFVIADVYFISEDGLNTFQTEDGSSYFIEE